MINETTHIKIENLSLVYDLYYDKTNTLKEFFVNKLTGKKYVEKQKAKLNALDNISFNINHGERLGVIGLNGAGKSTLLKVLSGILKPTSGKLYVKGSVQPLIEVGAGFNPEFSGRENIYLNGAMLGFNKKQIMEKEDEIIEFSELQDFIDVPVKYYSSGMTVRLGFTIATIIKPEILLMDEMLSAGDVSFIAKAKRRLDELLNIAKILILVSHDLELIKKLTPRAIVLNHGKIIFDGNTEEAINYYKDLYEK
jgi:ABC-type polysaccharide/polyol phosphate transport system ATPase subunit